MNKSDVCYITLHYLIIKLSYLPTFKSRSTFGHTFSLYHCWNKYSNYSNIRIAVEGSKDSDWPHLPLPQGWSLSPPTVRSYRRRWRWPAGPGRLSGWGECHHVRLLTSPWWPSISPACPCPRCGRETTGRPSLRDSSTQTPSDRASWQTFWEKRWKSPVLWAMIQQPTNQMWCNRVLCSLYWIWYLL